MLRHSRVNSSTITSIRKGPPQLVDHFLRRISLSAHRLDPPDPGRSLKLRLDCVQGERSIALSRFAGLRCPSEVAGLRWGDIVWDKGRMTVRSPKTANHEGHAVRVVPIAPELRPILQDLFEGAEVGVEAVVPRLRDPAVNLRTQFERIIAKAGVKPWPRLFHYMRASCATDWVERFPAHVVAGWLGHSPLIAARHYLQTRNAHFDLAAGVGAGRAAAANPATHTRPNHTTGDQAANLHESADNQNPLESSELVGVGAACDSVGAQETPAGAGAMGATGLEPVTSAM
ncbi:MAG: site-specific integrase [Phycisphaerales bacterium]|nr:site-specific integrase [Phycisphaerales bacterium]